MESRSIAGYTRRVVEIITAMGEVPGIVRFYYWIEKPQSMLTGPGDSATFAARLRSFFSGKPVPMRVELCFSDTMVDVSEYEAVMVANRIDE